MTSLYTAGGVTAIPSTVTSVTDATGTYLKFVPTSSLTLNTNYQVKWSKVSSKTINDRIISGTGTFTTVAGTQLTAPAISLDSVAKSAVSPYRSTYNHGDTTIYLSWPAVSNADTYTVYYRVAGILAWTTGATVNSGNATIAGGNWYYGQTVTALVSGEQTEVKVVASQTTGLTSGSYPTSLDSNVLSVADTTAPTGGLAFLATASTPASGSPVNTGTYKVSYATYTVALPGGAEKMSLPVVAAGGTLTAAFGTVTFQLNQARTQATIILAVPSNVDATGKTIVMTLADAAGNVYNSSLITATPVVATQTIMF